MPVSTIIQRQEDHPHNPGWWRFSRPRHEVRYEAPEIRDDQRWRYGSAAEAAEEAAEWDRQNPNG